MREKGSGKNLRGREEVPDRIVTFYLTLLGGGETGTRSEKEAGGKL